MLAGIKVGKKKKRKAPPEGAVPSAPSLEVTAVANQTETVSTGKGASSGNASIAEQLRQSLLTGSLLSSTEAARTSESSKPQTYAHSSRISSSIDALERRGRVGKAESHSTSQSTRDDVMLIPGAAPRTSTTDADLSVKEMVEQERSQTMSTAELETRNIMRTNKKRKIKLKTLARQDSDEDLQRQLESAVPSEPTSTRATARAAQRHHNIDVARHDRQDQITAKCWWWLESSNFSRHRLLALGNHVSLVMAPPNLSLTDYNHFYIVPLKHTESLTGAEDEVWDEIQRFQASLRAMYQKENKEVLFCETVLSSRGFWQTKMEAIVVPMATWQDTPLFFKSALTEQAEEWGTHQKLMKTTGKGLRRSVPKNFSYFYLQWDVNHAGYAQMIETTAFPRDFGVDTIAGVMGMDPIRFRRNLKTAPEQERQGVLTFLEKYKPFDWTVQLDS